jgi:hypothetical protein
MIVQDSTEFDGDACMKKTVMALEAGFRDPGVSLLFTPGGVAHVRRILDHSTCGLPRQSDRVLGQGRGRQQ